MIFELIDAHAKVEKQLANAIGINADAEVVRALDGELSELDQKIRDAVPADDEQARVKLDFFLSRIAFDGGNVINTNDIGTIEEIFRHILNGKKMATPSTTKPDQRSHPNIDDR